MPQGGHPGDHDYRRLPGDGAEHRPGDRPAQRRRGHYRSRAGGDGRGVAGEAGQDSQPLCTHGSRAEAAAGAGAEVPRRGGGHDRGRRQRRAGAQGGAHWRGHGRPRDRRGPRGRGPRLLDDAFESIVKGVRTGRRIFDNLQRAMLYIFVVHIPIAGSRWCRSCSVGRWCSCPSTWCF